MGEEKSNKNTDHVSNQTLHLAAKLFGKFARQFAFPTALVGMAAFMTACSGAGPKLPTTTSDQGVWIINASKPNGSGSPTTASGSYSCRNNNDGTFRIHYENRSSNGDNETGDTNDGVNFTVTTNGKTKTTTMPLPASCQAFVDQYVDVLTSNGFDNVTANKTGPVYTGIYMTPGLATSSSGQKLQAGLAQLTPDQQTRALRQISGQSLSHDMQSGFNLGSLSSNGVTQRLAALSSKLAITDGQSAINRANLAGNPMGAAQSALSLANQSRDAGTAGMWVSLSNNNAISGNNLTGGTALIQAGQDVALSKDVTIGVAASQSSLGQSKAGDTPTSVAGSVIAANIYLAYAPERMRITAQAGAQSGTIQQTRMISTAQSDIAFGKTGFSGSSAEARLGYELGESDGQKGGGFSLIPSLAVGYRAQTAKGYSERATTDFLALSVPELANRQTYAAIGLEARTVFQVNDIAAMPRASIGIERNNSRLGQNGVVALAIDPTAQFTTNLGAKSYGTITRYDLGIDLMGSEHGLALRADYQGSLSAQENVNALTLGMKLGF